MRNLLALLALFGFAGRTYGQKLPCEILTSKPFWAAYTVCPIDANGDSVDELFALNSYSAQVEQAPEDFVWFLPSPVEQGAYCHSWAADVTGDGVPEVIVTEEIRDSIWVHVIEADSGDGCRHFVATRQPYHGSHHDYDVVCAAFVDLNNDGAKEIILATTSGYEPGFGSRALYAIDSRTGTRLWRYGMGPKANSILAEDVNGDGRVELFVPTAATRNGCTENGTSDSSTYVISLDAQGQEVWTKEFRHLTGGGTTIALAREPGTGAPLLVVADECSIVGSAPDSIKVLDARDGKWLRSVPAEGIGRRFCVTDLDGDGSPEVVTTQGTKVIIRDLSLKVRRTREVGFAPVRLAQCGRLLGRRSTELAVTSGDGAGLLILDGRLRTVGRLDLGGKRITAEDVLLRRRGAGRPVAMIARIFAPWGPDESPTQTADVFRELQIVLNPREFPWAGVAAGLAGLLLCAVVGTILMGRSYREQMTTVVRGLTGQAGIVELDRRGRVQHTNPKARELLGGEGIPAGPIAQAVRAALGEVPGSTPKELPVALEGGKTVIARAARVRSGVMLTLEDISAVEYLQRVKAWAPVAQKLAHGIKNPLGTIMGAVEQIETEVNRRGMKAEGGSPAPEAKTEDRANAEARSEKLEARTQSEDAEKADERVKKYIGYVKDEVSRLKKMSDAFMRFTKLDPPELKPRDVNELVRKVVARYGWDVGKPEAVSLPRDENGDSPRPRERGRDPVQSPFSRGISLELSLDEQLPLVALDEEGIASVLDIVVENAIEAMSPDPALTTKTPSHQENVARTSDAERVLRIRTAGGSTVRVEVEDTGAGIPEKYIEKVFDPYFTYGKADGTGLGLALVKKIVEDHKGRMGITSVEGVGTTVTITLPAEKESG